MEALKLVQHNQVGIEVVEENFHKLFTEIPDHHASCRFVDRAVMNQVSNSLTIDFEIAPDWLQGLPIFARKVLIGVESNLAKFLRKAHRSV